MSFDDDKRKWKGHTYPVFPSAKVLIKREHYMPAVDALGSNIHSMFFDGESIILPESEIAAISMLRDRFGGTVEYGYGKEWEYATKAVKAGVAPRLIHLGSAVWSITGLSVSEMVHKALTEPELTRAEWQVLYVSSMEAH